MKKSLVASLAVASTLGFFTPLTSQAFGLGNLELKSALNEPFKAEIDVTALKSEERDDLQVKMASSAEFDKAGLERSLLLSKLQFDIVNQQGQVKILVTSKDPVKEPFLDFLLTATAGKGQLLREYTVLLDPPEFVKAAIETGQPATAQAVSEPAAVKEVQTTRYQYPSDSYKVKRSDTLWDVALKTRPQSSISVNQMMVALVKENPAAFTNQNINGLKAGYTLQIPSIDAITSLSNAQALAEVRQQNQAWKNRNKQTSKAVSQPVETVTSQTTSATEKTKVDMPAESTMAEMPELASGQDEAHLNLVAPEDVATTNQDADASSLGSSDVDKLTEQLTLAQETIEAQSQENVDFKLRMEALEEQVNTLTRLISVRDEELARLQELMKDENPQLAGQLQPQQVAVEGDTAETPDTAQADADTAMPEDTAAQNKPETETVESVQSDDTVIDNAADMMGLEGDDLQSLVEQVKQFVSEYKLEAGIGLILLLALLIVLGRRNKAVTWSEAVEKMDDDSSDITDAPLQGSAEEVEQSESVGTTRESALSPSRGKTAAELIEQADMFVGYADYVQARTSLEQAHIKEPDNSLVVYKLLFVLFKQGQTDAFLELLEESGFDSRNDEWNEICQWGKELDPDNALFTAQSEPVVDESVEPEVVAEPEIPVQEGTILDEAEKQETTNAQSDEEEHHIAFDLNDFASDNEIPASEEVESEAEPEEDELLSFDTNFSLDDKVENTPTETLSIDNLDLDDSAVEGEAAQVEEQASEKDENVISFDIDNESSDEDLSAFSIDVPEQEEAGEVEFELPESEDDTAEMEFDLGDFEDIDEAETKLDLAAAYIDMGDPDGAKSILNEVLVEGNEDQKNRAHSLLDSLS